MSNDSTGRDGDRLRIDFDPEPEEEIRLRRPPASAPGSGDDVVLRSAALMWQSERIPIPAEGVALGAGAGEIGSDGKSGAAPALIQATVDGHMITRTGERQVYVNGEQLITGERRPLSRSDAIAVGENLVHYLPAGQSSSRLPAIVPVEAGRLRATTRQIVIGRHENCDLRLDYPTVSRRHAVISSDRGGATIEDCGSATGLRVNGVTVKKTAIETGDEIAIGPFRILYDGEELVERAAADGLPIQADRVTVEIEGSTILQPTDLHLHGGELVALIGESGAGKTTLLKALSGVTEPNGGEVLCGGEPIRARMGEVGYVPQFDIVHAQLSVYEALDYAARLRLPPDTTASERHTRITEVIAELGLTERTHLRVSRLSGGQRKRVAVGIELLHRPGALFLDEPTTGLDPGLERMMMELFRRIADSGKTVTLVTHATGSMALCDRVVVMGRGGVKRFDGSPDDLLEAYGVKQFDDVYSKLAAGEAPTDTPARPQDRAAVRPSAGRGQPQVKQTFWYQTRILASRYATLMSRDRKNLISLAIQTLVLALLTAIIFLGDVFQFPPSETKSLTGKAAQLIFLMVTISIWMGSIASAREIVKERSVMVREHAVGVGMNAYITSKLIILLGLVAAQVIIYFMIVLIIKPVATAELTLLSILIVSSWLAVLLGLVVSAWADSEDQATGLIPILLVPQLLLGGALVTHNEMPGFVATLANLAPSRWAFDAAGTAIDMPARLAGTGKPQAVDLALQEGYGPDFFHLEMLPFLLVAGLFFAVLYGSLAWFIRRIDTE